MNHKKECELMNVIISNKFRVELRNVNIPVGKELIGQYVIDDIINSFSNFEFSKLIIDLTSIKDQDNLQAFQRMASTFDMNNIIFYIDGNKDNKLISELIPFGIYNFANSPISVKSLTEQANSYKDVAHYHNVTVEADINVAMSGGTKIIGFKNLTPNAGSTSLIYMSLKYLETLYRVLVIEVNKNDFGIYQTESSISVNESEFVNKLNQAINFDVVLVDLNDSKLDSLCSDVLYLMEPSIIKLERFSRATPNISESLKNKKVVLNKSFLTSDDLSKLEFEGKFKVFFNLPPINDRSNKSEHIIALYKKLGLDKKDAKKRKKRK